MTRLQKLITTAAITAHNSRDWKSVTFKGEEHTLRVVPDDEVAFLHQVEEIEDDGAIAGWLIADVTATKIDSTDYEVKVLLLEKEE
jgi:hypothetical protein